MTFDEYATEAAKTALYVNAGNNVIYPVLGLASEAGEVAGIVKKVLRDDGGVFSDDRKKKLEAELGDVLWYVARVAAEMDLSLDAVAKQNIQKLASRQERGVLQGSGDNR
ncbi:MAG: nucleoside triphosphate pyrophosphohydrolase family protein [Patescibacteria group bacterium]